ncbi:MAG: helix-turn-helix domain-containing protein [Anaerolineae bacterium]|nr:helix-turn-helix domain-containing protein [Anaerolineae bacterium]
MARRKSSLTVGGEQLRLLRESRGKTQLTLELDASLGVGYLQRLESGKVQQPERDTLERILTALAVNFAERREVMQQFGYAVPLTIPDAAEIQWAISVFQGEMANITVPAYVLDCSHRLLTWNPLADKLYGLGRFTMGEDRPDYLLMPRLIFDPRLKVSPCIVNGEEFYPSQIRVLKYERLRCGVDSWYDGFIEEMRHYGDFDRYWSRYGREQSQFTMRPLSPFKLDLGGSRLAQFRIISESFVQDQRFRVIYCLPADAETIRWCEG